VSITVFVEPPVPIIPDPQATLLEVLINDIFGCVTRMKHWGIKGGCVAAHDKEGCQGKQYQFIRIMWIHEYILLPCRPSSPRSLLEGILYLVWNYKNF